MSDKKQREAVAGQPPVPPPVDHDKDEGKIPALVGEPNKKDDSSSDNEDIVELPADSPERPQNWSFRKKFWHTLAFASGTFVTQFSSSILSPSVEMFQKQYHVGRVVALLPTSLFVIGIGFGPMIMAPMSEIYGRKIGVFVPMLISSLLTMWSATASGWATIVVVRFFAGLFGAAPLVTSGGALADMWSASSRAGALAVMGACVIVGASVSPIIGSLIIQGNRSHLDGWRWCMWLAAFMSLAVSVPGLLFVSEPYLPSVEEKKARTLRVEHGEWAMHARHEMWHLTMKEFVMVHLARPIQLFLTPIVMLIALYASFVYGVMYLIITSVSLSFNDTRGWSNTVMYLPLLGYGIGFVLGCFGNFLGSRRYSRLLQQNNGQKLPPEQRLIPVMLMGWTFPVGLFIYSWTQFSSVHWFVPVLGLAFCGAGVAFAFQGCLVYLVDFSRYPASATASSTLVRSIFGGVFPLFGKQMFDTLGYHWGASLLGFLGVLFTPVPWIYFFWGPQIRRHTPYSHLVA